MSEGELPPGRFVSKTPGKHREAYGLDRQHYIRQFSNLILQYSVLMFKMNKTTILKQEIYFQTVLLISFVRMAL